MCRIALIWRPKDAICHVERDLLLIDHAQTIAMHEDRGQKDGFGLSAGTRIIFKSAEWYQYADLKAMREALLQKPAYPLLMHLRAASAETKMRVDDTHPYEQGGIVFAHNGNVKNSVGVNKTENEPHTDTYAAFKTLIAHLNGEMPTIQSLKEWIEKTFNHNDHFVFVIVVNNATYIVRGKETRTLYVACLEENGLFFHTSKEALANTLRWYNAFFDANVEEKVQEVNPHTILAIRKDGEMEALEFKLKTPPFHIVKTNIDWLPKPVYQPARKSSDEARVTLYMRVKDASLGDMAETKIAMLQHALDTNFEFAEAMYYTLPTPKLPSFGDLLKILNDEDLIWQWRSKFLALKREGLVQQAIEWAFTTGKLPVLYQKEEKS